MPDNTVPDSGQDPGPIETGPVASLADNDPGPIEFGNVVLKSFSRSPADPMAGRDLHLGHVLERDDDGR